MSIEARFSEWDISSIMLKFKDHQINLSPGFQRKSVWTLTDRRRLIQSIIQGYPLPSIFLYKRNENGKVIYDVIDGKQRLETILMFTRLGKFKRESFETKLDIGEGSEEWIDWKTLNKRFHNWLYKFNLYKFQTVELEGDLPDIIDLFVRINSTGKKLTSAEKRHAKFYESPFLKEAARLFSRFNKYIQNQRILSPSQIGRMKGVELFSELLMSIHKGEPIDKKISLDRTLGNEDINRNTLSRLSREFIRTINIAKKMFPDLKTTRFRNSVEFYTLFMVVWEMDKEKFALTDKRKNKMAFELMRKFSNSVDELSEHLKKAKPAKRDQGIYSDYLLTVRGDTDSSATRKRRLGIIRGLLVSLYERKDEKRIFSPEQRRIIWNSDENRLCSKCKKSLTWEDFTVDHIIPYIKGGGTRLKNAQLMCRHCNSRKGGR